MKPALPLIVRVGDRRVEQARRALGEALAEQRAADNRRAQAARLFQQSEIWAQEADSDLRAQPQCEQRQLLREVRGRDVVRAQGELHAAEDAFAAAKMVTQSASQALLRAETRANEFARLLRRQRAQAAEQAALREEDDLCGRVKAF